MKRILFLACLIVSAGVSAMDLSVLRHNREWKKIAKNEYAINFDGSRTWPALELKSPVLKPKPFTSLSLTDTVRTAPCIPRWPSVIPDMENPVFHMSDGAAERSIPELLSISGPLMREMGVLLCL